MLAQNMRIILKGCLAEGRFQILEICSFVDEKDWGSVNVLALIPLSLSTTSSKSFENIREAMLLIRKSTNNLTKVDTSVNTNTDIQQSRGLAVFTYLFFTHHLFMVIQHNTDPDPLVPFLYKASLQCSNAISKGALLDTVKDEMDDLMLYFQYVEKNMEPRYPLFGLVQQLDFKSISAIQGCPKITHSVP